MQALRDLRLAQQAVHLAERPSIAAAGDDDGWVATEIGMAVGLSESQVRRRLDWADALDRYRAVDALATEGERRRGPFNSSSTTSTSWRIWSRPRSWPWWKPGSWHGCATTDGRWRS